MQWFLAEAGSGQRHRESQVEKFFLTDASADQAEDLVREGPQNSEDARLDGSEPVKIRIAIGLLAADHAATYAAGLHPHLPVLTKSLPSMAAAHGACRYLAFEDFNTTGLTGDESVERRYDGEPANAFHTFFRAEGKTDKNHGERGSHGVGKIALMAASEIHAVLGLTRRHDDGKSLLFGTAVLRTHVLNGKHYEGDAWFGLKQDARVLPETDPAVIESFCRDFSLARENEPGFSVVIPWLKPDVTTDAVIDAIFRGHAYPILRGDLVFEVVDESGNATLVDRTTFFSVLDARSDEALKTQVRPVAELTQWALTSPTPTQLGEHGSTAPKWTDANLITPAMRDAAHTPFEAGTPVFFRVPIVVRPKGESPQKSFFDVFIQKEDRNGPAARSSIQYLRKGLSISGMKKTAAGVRALVIADDAAVAEFLRRAENPSHTRWDPKTVREHYTYHAATLAFVVDSVTRIMSLLAPPEGLEPSLLDDIFNLPAPGQKRSGPRKGLPRKGEVKPDGPPPPPPPPITIRPKWWQVTSRTGGFSVRTNPKVVASSLPRELQLVAAYDVSDGNPFSQWKPFDFVLGNATTNPVRLRGRNVTLLPGKKGNRLAIRVTAADFELEVLGFEPSRDVVVKTWEDRPANAADASGDSTAETDDGDFETATAAAEVTGD